MYGLYTYIWIHLGSLEDKGLSKMSDQLEGSEVY